MARNTYHQAVIGEWIAVTRKHIEKCCQCGLTHEVEYRYNEDQVEYRVLRIFKARAPKSSHLTTPRSRLRRAVK